MYRLDEIPPFLLVITHIFLKKGDRLKIGLHNPNYAVAILNKP
jgi:hypothetical protein